MAKTSSLNEAVLQVQHSGIELSKDASANYGDYATLGNVLDVLRPELEKAGLVVEQCPNVLQNGPESTPVLTTVLIHVESDQARMYHTPLVEVNNMQKVGSSITYARRYALVSIFLLDADDDDDGNAAAGEAAASTVVKKKAAASGGKRVL